MSKTGEQVICKSGHVSVSVYQNKVFFKLADTCKASGTERQVSKTIQIDSDEAQASINALLPYASVPTT